MLAVEDDQMTLGFPAPPDAARGSRLLPQGWHHRARHDPRQSPHGRGQHAYPRCRERRHRAGLRRDSTGPIVLTFDNDRSGRTTEVSFDGTQAYPW